MCKHNFVQVLDEDGEPVIYEETHGVFNRTITYTALLYCTFCLEQKLMEV